MHKNYSSNQGYLPKQQSRLLLVEIEGTPKVIITNDFLNQVKYLCQKVSSVEWSGIVYYNIKGSIKDPDNLVITPKYIFPMDIGTSGFTSYEPAKDKEHNKFFMSILDEIEVGMRKGHIHSHNNMGVYFSNTDEEELINNAPTYTSYYFSIIVNNRMEMVARLARHAKIKNDITRLYADENGKTYNIKAFEEKEVVFYHETKIEKPGLKVPDYLVNKLNILIAAKEEEKRKKKEKKERVIAYRRDGIFPRNVNNSFPQVIQPSLFTNQPVDINYSADEVQRFGAAWILNSPKTKTELVHALDLFEQECNSSKKDIRSTIQENINELSATIGDIYGELFDPMDDEIEMVDTLTQLCSYIAEYRNDFPYAVRIMEQSINEITNKLLG